MRWTILSGALWVTIAAIWLAVDVAGSSSELAYRLTVPQYTEQYRQEDDPVKRALLVDALGRRGSPVYVPLLEAAARDPDPRVRFFAQENLVRYSEGSTIHAARDELNRLTCRDWFVEGRFSPIVSAPLGVWSFGESTWDGTGWQRCETLASSADWQDYLERHRHFAWKRDALWFAARSAYREGERDRALVLLDASLREPVAWLHGAQLDWNSLRYFVVEIADRDDLARWASQREQWSPATWYAVRYAQGLERFRALDFAQAAAIWETLDDTPIQRSIFDPADPMAWPRQQRDLYLPGRPAERAALARRLAAADDLPEALVQEQLVRHAGLFEAWLFVDESVSHPTVAYVSLPEDGSPRTLLRVSQLYRRDGQHYHNDAWKQRASALDARVRQTDGPEAAFADFQWRLRQVDHHLLMADYPFPDSPWAAHAALWSQHSDGTGVIWHTYQAAGELTLQPPPLASITGLRPIIEE